MDVSQQLADFEAKNALNVLERPTPVDCDAGLLAAYDTTPVDAAEYSDLEPHLLALTLTSTQALLGSLFTLATTQTDNGPVAQLPDPIFQLPREKPVPKPKPLTKWERYANAKGISHSKKEKKVWDEERQEWVNRWGFGGKNRDAEDQWLHEVKDGSDPNADPRAAARADRKARVAKNERQQARNLADAAAVPSSVSALNRPANLAAGSQTDKASARTKRKSELERSMLVSKTATASLGRFDNKIAGEPRAKGIKRKFEANVGDYSSEKGMAMNLLGKLDVAERKKAPKKGGAGVEGDVNVRKAIRHEDRMKQRSNTMSKRRK